MKFGLPDLTLSEGLHVIETILVLSTAHLLPHTCNAWLWETDQSVWPKGETGWFIHIPDTDPEGLPSDLAECFLLARAQNCDWIMFDAGAPVLNLLPTYSL